MERRLRESPVFEGVGQAEFPSFLAIASKRSLPAGEYAFLLGDGLDALYVVLSGTVELCFPFSFGGNVKDVPVESVEPGEPIGWSALVRPYRSTLSARAAQASEMAAFARKDLMNLFEANPRAGYQFMMRICEIMGRRLHKVQALWARELQSAVSAEFGDLPEPSE